MNRNDANGHSGASAAERPRTNILVVDDVPDRLVAMQVILEELGQNVVCATSGREALRRLLSDEFAVILLDVNMPELDGFETAALIRQRKRSEHTPIIFVTAFGDETHAFHGYSLGAVDYILTPVVPEVLRAKVRVFVDLFQKNEQLREHARRQAALVELADRRAAQLRTMASELAHAEQRERRRLSQILHDHIQQLLVAATMRVIRAQMHAPTSGARQELSEVKELLEQSISASRSLATELSPPVLNDSGLASALEWLGRWMREKHGLAVQIDCQAGVHLVAEELRLTMFQAVRELLFNVVKHSGSTAARLRMDRPDDAWVQVAVEDDGAGFDVSRAATPGGHEGLGLFSIRERLETLGGRMEIDSRQGAGTRIRLFAPLLSADEEAAGGSVSTAFARESAELAGAAGALGAAVRGGEGPNGSAVRIRVLLADDHAIVRKGLKGLLQDLPDIEIVGEAADGNEALRQARELSPDVIIMDVNMPRMSGIEATRCIKQEQPSISVIGLSLHEEHEVISSLLSAGASSYVKKGGPPDDLLRAIRAIRALVPAGTE
ncbi:MAG TPA: response regulator [Planctomycetaceae bacterium]|nr:response regulator [Planctomycetaceae bacterium]